jgi:hypothetical protein
MSELPEQVQLRQHLAEMRRAARGIGADVAIEVETSFKTLDDKITRLGRSTAKELRYDIRDIQDDFAALGQRLDEGVARLPHNVKVGATAAASAIGSGAVRVAGATRDAFESAGHRASEGTKNALASAAGVNRKPIKEWRDTDGSDGR